MPTQERYKSIDLLRGLNLVVMFLVSSSSPVPQLRHGKWLECTLADLVYPGFLFIAGISMAISTARSFERGRKPTQVSVRALRRVAGIFAVGVVLTAISLRAPRIQMGTLQSIATALLVALPVVFLGWRGRLIYLAGFLGFQTVLLSVNPLGVSSNAWSAQGNLAEQLDIAILGKYRGVEGLLGSVFSGSFVILGLVAGSWLQKSRGRYWLARMSVLSLALFALGAWSSLIIPSVSRLVSPSFVFLAGGLLVASIGAAVFVIERWSCPPLFRPVVHAGENPLAVFAGVKLFQDLVLRASFGAPAIQVNDQIRHLVAESFGPTAALLVVPIIKVVFGLVLAAYLSTKQVRIRL